MDTQQLIDAAEKAGIPIRAHYDEDGATPADLKRFADLIRAEVIRECIAECVAGADACTGRLRAMLGDDDA